MIEQRLRTSLLVAAGFALTALAPGDASAQNANCNNPMSQAEINYCSGVDFENADKRLNRVYQRVIARNRNDGGDPPYDAKSWEDALRKSQRAWVAFRDADCKGLVTRDWTGGSGMPMAVNSCMTQLTLQRIKALEERYGRR